MIQFQTALRPDVIHKAPLQPGQQLLRVLVRPALIRRCGESTSTMPWSVIPKRHSSCGRLVMPCTRRV